MFDRGGDISELENILELVTDAWNYFPHKALGGISSAEKSLEYKSKKQVQVIEKWDDLIIRGDLNYADKSR